MPILFRPPAAPLSTSVSVRLTETEKQQVQAYADLRHVSLSEAARRLMNRALGQVL
jgi:hypothetical protein